MLLFNLQKIVIENKNHHSTKCDGTPNFHRIIDKLLKNIVFTQLSILIFYNWNIKSKLEKKFKDGVYRHWRYVKHLAGNSKFKFEKYPSQFQIDRLQIVNYPHVWRAKRSC